MRSTKFLWLILFTFVLAIPFAADAQKKKGEKERAEMKAQVKNAPDGDATPGKKAPEGVVIRGNKLTLKAGYQFEKPSGNTVAVSRANNGGISGSFSCSCVEGNPGVCQLSINKDVAVCGGTCKDCRLDIVIDPKAVPIKKIQWEKAPQKKANK